MRTDFSVFRERVVEACQARNTTPAKLSSATGLGARRAIALRLSGPDALDLYRVGQIADVLDVSIDWLLGRSNVMEVTGMPEPPKKRAKKAGKEKPPA